MAMGEGDTPTRTPTKAPTGRAAAPGADAGARGERPYAAPALDKGLDILELLADSEGGLTMAEMAPCLGRSISEIFRMVVTLERRGWVTIEPGDRYRLSSRMFELAHRYPPLKNLSEAAMPTIQKLARQTQQSCHISIMQAGRSDGMQTMEMAAKDMAMRRKIAREVAISITNNPRLFDDLNPMGPRPTRPQ